ncbi:hypothetical protein GGR55DRAFT_655578 [Xylaria sp. FL0064]|nr:hypothetical protein GGR55DRAFT_655578 [Xylaria sp. FL0064]
MELTPIRVRGKRRAGNQLLVAPPPKRVHNKDRSQKKQAWTRHPKASYLEKSMPLEVLEQIFWLSENVNFPRASPRLGRLLSGPSTLRETFLCAFGPTWEVWFGCINGGNKIWRPDFPVVHSYAGWDEDADRFGGNPDFQSDLLACSWTTIDMILECRDIWIRRHARNRLFECSPIWHQIHYWEGPWPYHLYGRNDVKDAKRYFYYDYEAIRHADNTIYDSDMLYFSERDLSTWIEVHRSTRIPDDLITGPWDESSLQKLFWLVQAGARLSPAQTWEVTREGFVNALSDRYAPNMTAIRLLNILHAFENWPEQVRFEESRDVNDTMFLAVDRCRGYGGDVSLPPKYFYLRRILKSAAFDHILLKRSTVS